MKKLLLSATTFLMLCGVAQARTYFAFDIISPPENIISRKCYPVEGDNIQSIINSFLSPLPKPTQKQILSLYIYPDGHSAIETIHLGPQDGGVTETINLESNADACELIRSAVMTQGKYTPDITHDE